MKMNLSLLTLVLANFLTLSAFAQTTTLNGTVKNSDSKENIPAVSVTVKGSTIGTITDAKGNFSIEISEFPATLVFSSVGYQTQELVVTNSLDIINIAFKPTGTLGQEVVVAATRTEVKTLEAPVTIERMNKTVILETPSPSFYDAIGHLKGVDVVTSSIMFKTPGTRGFNGSGNLRMNQLVDGMDNQAPGLNFSVGNIVGLNELDVDNVELLPGASSALYGSGGMTGTLLMTSKDPFRFQGFSAQVKEGVNHIDDPNSTGAALYQDYAIRFAKAFNNKFAFKISSEYTQAKDWFASDYRNYSIAQGKPVGGDRSQSDYNGINTYGDESAYFNVQQQLKNAAAQAIAGGNPGLGAQLNALAAATPANSGVTRTGYSENDLTNHKAYNFKASAGLYYKLSEATTASLTGNFGSASTVYQGTDKYQLKNVQIGQYKAEVAGRHFYVRAYTTQENAGSSYDMVASATLLNEAYAPTATVWAPTYMGTYTPAFAAALGAGQTPAQAYLTASNAARAAADANRFQPGTAQYKKSLDSLNSIAIPNGGKFNDKTNLYVAEGMYDFSDYFKWADIMIGASTREFVLNSHGTIFADTAGRININESGAFIQIQKGFFDSTLKITLAGRYDKNSNFDGRFTPRATVVYEVAHNNFIRASYQTAYRFPSTQNQYIDLQTGTAHLIGGLPSFINEYGLTSNTYDTASLNKYAATGTPPTQYQFKQFKPETVQSYEIGYKTLIKNKLLIDVYGFYAQYTNFIGLTILIKDPLTQPITAANTFGIYTNSSNKVNTVGAGAGVDYLLPKGFIASGNIAYNDLSGADNTIQTDFNTPKIKFNLSFSNYTIKKVYGFNVTYRWQESYEYQSSFITGNTPAFGTLDAQVSRKLPRLFHSMIKIGATNLLNKYYVDAIGNPSIGALYYVSLGINVF
jgi:outer membrane receptor protein involved in Fe transport